MWLVDRVCGWGVIWTLWVGMGFGLETVTGECGASPAVVGSLSEREERAAGWLLAHLEEVEWGNGKGKVRVIAWKDPTLASEDRNMLAGYLITDTLWAAHALRAIGLPEGEAVEAELGRIGWAGNGLHEVLFRAVDPIRHRALDEDFVHGHSLGVFRIRDGKRVDVRVFRMKHDPDYSVGHPYLFAEHAVYHALHDAWSGRVAAGRERIREMIRRDEGAGPQGPDRQWWDAQRRILVDHVTEGEWRELAEGRRSRCRHFTFKLGLLVYAIRVLGMEEELRGVLPGMEARLWSAQDSRGGLAHFVDVDSMGGCVPAEDATGEATAIGILASRAKARWEN